MPTITKEKALEDTRDMWLWLAANPGKYKWDYNKTLGVNNPHYLNECACCEFARIEGKGLFDRQMDCTKCPLKSLWGSDFGACENSNSPYRKWRDKQLYTDTHSAAQIANAASEELRKLREGQQYKSSNTCNVVEPEDPYAELKQAHKEGKQIQQLCGTEWRDVSYPLWRTESAYRIKPTPKYRPWKNNERPLDALFRLKNNSEPGWSKILSMNKQYEVSFASRGIINYFSMQELFETGEHSLDHGKTWLSCGVLCEE